MALFRVYWRRQRKRLKQRELNNYPATPAEYYSGFHPGSKAVIARRSKFVRRRQGLTELNQYPAAAVAVEVVATLSLGKHRTAFRRKHRALSELNQYPATPAGYYSGFHPGSRSIVARRSKFVRRRQALAELNQYPATPVVTFELVSTLSLGKHRVAFNRRHQAPAEINQYPATPPVVFEYLPPLFLQQRRASFKRGIGVLPELNEYPAITACLPSTATRNVEIAKHERKFVNLLELDLDFCNNTYGVSPCTAGRKNSGTAQAGGAATITLAAGASAVDDFYNTMVVRITGGTGSGQENIITDYVGATKVATVQDAWATVPDNTSVYDVINRPGACYNTFETCQDKPNYSKGTKTYKFISEGADIPPGELMRPYISGVNVTPTTIEPEKGLARRNKITIKLKDGPESDNQTDPYILNRASAAGSTWWARFINRNPFYIGRIARIKRGPAAAPWNQETLITELYIIESIDGPDSASGVTVILKDPLKLSERNKLPAPTDGKLLTAFKAVADGGTAQAGSATTITLRNEANPTDDFYNDYAVKITGGLGQDQERIISDYDGATRVATVSVAFATVPDSSTIYEVQILELTLDAGKISQYNDPAVTGDREFVRLGKEIIEYTAISGDKLTWPDTSYRAAFGSTAKDHSAKAGVQLCKTFIDIAYTTVINTLLNEAGIANKYIDTALLIDQEITWHGAKDNVTSCISEPTNVNTLLKELAINANANMWWCSAGQKVKYKVDAPNPPSSTAIKTINDESGLKLDTVKVKKLDNLRITRAAMFYDVIDFADSLREARNFELAEMFIDLDKEGPNEFNDVVPRTEFSRWKSSANALAAKIWANKKLSNFKYPPTEVTFSVDPKDYDIATGDEVVLTTDQIPDSAGGSKTVRGLVVSTRDRGKHIDYTIRSTDRDRRYAFVAPNGTADYPTDTDYAHVAQNDGLMSDGGEPYIVI